MSTTKLMGLLTPMQCRWITGSTTWQPVTVVWTLSLTYHLTDIGPLVPRALGRG